jgi:hypothetical protein
MVELFYRLLKLLGSFGLKPSGEFCEIHISRVVGQLIAGL